MTKKIRRVGKSQHYQLWFRWSGILVELTPYFFFARIASNALRVVELVVVYLDFWLNASLVSKSWKREHFSSLDK